MILEGGKSPKARKRRFSWNHPLGEIAQERRVNCEKKGEPVGAHRGLKRSQSATGSQAGKGAQRGEKQELTSY